MPIVGWLPSYDRSLLRFDLIAGATIWGLLVPESIAYAGLAGLPPEAGLYTLLATLAAYACFGTSRHLVVAATSAAAVLLASSVADVGPASAAEYAADGAALVLFCGALFLLAGLLGLGFVAQFLSRPVMEGFVFGLAIFVTVSQLPKLFGIAKGDGDTIRQFAHLLGHLGDTSGATLAVGAAALALLFGVERFAPRVPGGLVALVAGIAISAALDLASHGVADRRRRAERAAGPRLAARRLGRRADAARGGRRARARDLQRVARRGGRRSRRSTATRSTRTRS